MFHRQLRRNIRLKLRACQVTWEVSDEAGIYTVKVPPEVDREVVDYVIGELRRVSGIAWITAAKRLRAFRFKETTANADFEEIEKEVEELALSQYQPNLSFAVRVNRTNKNLPLTSLQMQSRLGQKIRDRTLWKQVDLNNPGITFHVDLRCAATFIHGAKLRGAGGLPVGTSGRVLAMLSGGIDSPVAAYLMSRRGCRVDFIHFTANSVDREEVLKSKIWRLASHLDQFTQGSNLYVVPYVYFDLALMRRKIDYELVLFRRFMMRVGECLAKRTRARAIVTGDNLSQVASQTLLNLVATSQAAAMPVLRPLLAFDKDETISIAERIGTYAISIEPYKDCCALISGNPKTRSFHAKLEELEQRAFPDYQALIDKTLAEIVALNLQDPTRTLPEMEQTPKDR